MVTGEVQKMVMEGVKEMISPHQMKINLHLLKMALEQIITKF